MENDDFIPLSAYLKQEFHNEARTKGSYKTTSTLANFNPRGNKTCSKCKTSYPRAQYYKDNRNKDGLSVHCKLCQRQASHEAYLRRSEGVHRRNSKYSRAQDKANYFGDMLWRDKLWKYKLEGTNLYYVKTNPHKWKELLLNYRAHAPRQFIKVLSPQEIKTRRIID